MGPGVFHLAQLLVEEWSTFERDKFIRGMQRALVNLKVGDSYLGLTLGKIYAENFESGQDRYLGYQ